MSCAGRVLCIGWTVMCVAGAYAESNVVRRVVRRGETLETIVEAQYGSTRMAPLIRVVNHLSEAEPAREGQRLLLPTTSDFFLAPFGMEDTGTTRWLRPRRHHATGETVLPMLIRTAPDEGNPHRRRFLLLEISGLPYRMLFDSVAMARAYGELEALHRVDRWEIIDLDNDGDLDVRCRTAGGAGAPLTDVVFHWSRAAERYEPHVVFSDVAPTAERTERDAEGRIVFVYRPAGAAQTVRVPWVDLRRGAMAVLDAVPDDLLPPPALPAADREAGGDVRRLLAVLDTERIRALGAAAVRERYPQLDVSRLDRGMVLCVASADETAQRHVYVSWLGRVALELQRGATSREDRKKVNKVQVKMTADGQILDVATSTVWLGRSSGAADD